MIMDRCLIYVQSENKYHEQCVHNLMQIKEALESFVIYSKLIACSPREVFASSSSLLKIHELDLVTE